MNRTMPWLGRVPGIPMRLVAIPSGSVMFASAVTTLPLIADAPLLPPLGFVLLISWRLLRSDIWPVWIGLPLGLWDDLLSGQPVGSAVALWTFAMLGMDALDRRVVWRDYRIDLVIAAVALAVYMVLSALFNRVGDGAAMLRLVGPHYVWSLFLVPPAMRLVAWLDRWRLRR